jgi:hypothetical protein
VIGQILIKTDSFMKEENRALIDESNKAAASGRGTHGRCHRTDVTSYRISLSVTPSAADIGTS